MSKLKYLSKNIALFSISNFVSKILVFLLVPFYTNVLSTYEYGVADVIQVTLLLLVPMATVNIGEAALRFGIEEAENRSGIFKVGFKYVFRAIVFVAFICFALRGVVASVPVSFILNPDEIRWYLLLFVFLFFTDAVYEFLILFFQGCESVETIVIGSISCTIATIGFNLFFLLGLKIGLNGYLYSQILAYLMASVVMLLIGKKKEIISDNLSTTEDLEKRMLEYSRPMVVYSTASWINNAVDRYFVLYLCGAAINGIYGVAYKIPAILMVFQRIFAQAWQLSATKAHKDSDSKEFFSEMYKIYNSFMVLGCGFLILIVKPLAMFLFKKGFYEAWKLVPPLLISVIFGALTGFLGSICLAHKDSKSMGRATGIGALVNVVLNILLIPMFSAMGAAIATGISYFAMGTMALVFVKKHVDINVAFVRNIITYIIIVAESVVMINETYAHYPICGLLFGLLIILYYRDFVEIINTLLSRFAKGNEK